MKKAVSPLISWVLLIGLSVAIGALVTNWALDQAKNVNVEEMAEGGLYCVDVFLSVDGACIVSSSDGKNTIRLTLNNRGVYSITKLAVDLKSSSDLKSEILTLSSPISLNSVRYDQTLVYQGDIKSIKITPIVNIEGKDLSCSEKKVLLTDQDMLNNIGNQNCE